MLIVQRAAADPDAELEAKLEKLRQARGKTPYGQGVKAASKEKVSAPPEPAPAPKPAGGKVAYDFDGETLHYEGAPYWGDLALNVVLGTTLVWLPLTLASIGRCSFVKYRFTDRRFMIQTAAPWKTEQVDVAYQEVASVVTVGRGFGFWGDLVITLRNNDKVELRSLENYRDLRDYIQARRDALAPAAPSPPPSQGGGGSGTARAKGAQLTAAELMGEEVPAGKGKGFA